MLGADGVERVGISVRADGHRVLIQQEFTHELKRPNWVADASGSVSIPRSIRNQFLQLLTRAIQLVSANLPSRPRRAFFTGGACCLRYRFGRLGGPGDELRKRQALLWRRTFHRGGFASLVYAQFAAPRFSAAVVAGVAAATVLAGAVGRVGFLSYPLNSPWTEFAGEFAVGAQWRFAANVSLCPLAMSKAPVECGLRVVIYSPSRYRLIHRSRGEVRAVPVSRIPRLSRGSVRLVS